MSVGIVHFGVGGFHRAHQAMYVDSLMDQGKALDWGICGGPPTACRNSCCQLSGRISPRGGTFASPRRWSPAGPVMRQGIDEEGQPIEIVDRLAAQLKAIAGTQGTEPTAFIANRELFGDLIDEPAFVEPYVATLNSLRTRGSRATLEALAT